MAQPIAATTTLTSSGTSTPIMLDPTAMVTSVLLNMSGLATSTSTAGAADVTIQVTYDTFVATATSSVVWTNYSTTHYSTATLDGALLKIDGPIAGLRLSSTGVPNTWGGATIYLKALQRITAGP